ncbi:8208_t:CDS:1, partial [Funneliformis mosseae]
MSLMFIPHDTDTRRQTNRKKAPNMFILYRKDMMRTKPPMMTMTKFSKVISIKWKNLPDYEKAKWQRKSQLIRDLGENIDESMYDKCEDCLKQHLHVNSRIPQTDECRS